MREEDEEEGRATGKPTVERANAKNSIVSENFARPLMTDLLSRPLGTEVFSQKSLQCPVDGGKFYISECNNGGFDFKRVDGNIGNSVLMRVHGSPRTQLFNPYQCRGSPVLQSLINIRCTEGIYCDNGEKFTYFDKGWKRSPWISQQLNRPWIGSTTFLRK